MDALRPRLAALLDKPGGVEVVVDQDLGASGPGKVWSFGELDTLARQTANLGVTADTVKIHVLFLDGEYGTPEGGTVLGLAWNQVNLAIFAESIEDGCAALGLGVLERQLCADAEQAVWLHEIGHVIGLVDNGLPMVLNHEDSAHPAHDHDANCVMYWAYEGDAVLQRIADDLLQTGNSALDFDQACRNDVAAVRDAP
jgi:hypothetical protein